MRKAKFWTTLSIAAALAIAAPFFTDAGFGHLLLVISLQIFLTLPVAITALILYAVHRKKPDHQHTFAKLLATVALAFFIQTLSLPIIAARENHRVQAAKHYCETLIPLIEQYQLDNHEYPADLKQLNPTLPIPEFLSHQKIYQSTPDGYAFNFHTPGSFLNSYLYDSNSKQWSAID